MGGLNLILNIKDKIKVNMKNIIIFIGGMILGAFIFVGFSSTDNYNNDTTYLHGLTLLEQDRKCIVKNNSFVVIQFLKKGSALVELKNNSTFNDVFLIIDEDKLFYEGEEIKIQQGKCARQIGIYEYMTIGGKVRKTVAAVKIDNITK